MTLRLRVRAIPGMERNRSGEVDADLLHALPGEVAEEGGTGVGDVDLDHPVVERTGAELGAELLPLGVADPSPGVEAVGRSPWPPGGRQAASRGRGARPGDPRRPPGTGPDLAGLLLANEGDGSLDQIADHRLDVAAHVAHLGELARLDLHERSLGERARRRAISVLPTPVGPMRMMFFGVISS